MINSIAQSTTDVWSYNCNSWFWCTRQIVGSRSLQCMMKHSSTGIHSLAKLRYMVWHKNHLMCSLN